MIGRLRGVVAEIELDHALIEVGGLNGGVGYVVRMGARALSRLPAVDEPVTLAIESRTTEDGTTLYGFLTRDDRSAFTILTAVQGVGPKAALGVLDVLPPSDLAQACARGDTAAVARAQGVGPKLAQRIVVELKGKPLAAGPTVAGFATSPSAPAPPKPSLAGEAVSALMGLGLAEPLARRAVETAAARLEPDAALPALIKAALQESAR